MFSAVGGRDHIGTPCWAQLLSRVCAACVSGRRLLRPLYARGQVLTLGRSRPVGKRRAPTRRSGSSGSRSNNFIKVANATKAHSGERIVVPLISAASGQED